MKTALSLFLFVALISATGCQTQAEREEAAVKAWWDSMSPTSGIKCHMGTFDNFKRWQQNEPVVWSEADRMPFEGGWDIKELENNLWLQHDTETPIH